MTTTEIAKYKNGNCTVTLFDDGTKIREFPDSDSPCPTFPESIDVKITDYCDLGCRYCHESSTVKGKDGNLEKLLECLSGLPEGVEIAIGGGNPLSHSGLKWFLRELQKKGIIANLTVNQAHLGISYSLVHDIIKEKLVRGLGVSITGSYYANLAKLAQNTNNVVPHVIAGVNNPGVIKDLIDIGVNKVLILGYKKFGRGESFFNDKISDGLSEWVREVPQYIGKCTLSFDNLAIEQLRVKRLFTKEGWDKFYMGDDGKFSMYVDAVEKTYAKTSRSVERTPFVNMTLLEFFNTLKKIDDQYKAPGSNEQANTRSVQGVYT